MCNCVVCSAKYCSSLSNFVPSCSPSIYSHLIPLVDIDGHLHLLKRRNVVQDIIQSSSSFKADKQLGRARGTC